MSKTGYKPRKPRSLKEATAELVGAVGGFKVAAEHCRVQTASLFKYTDDSEENADRFIPVDIVQVLEAEAPYPFVTEYLADKSHYLLVPVPEDDASELTLDVIQTGEQTARLFRNWAEFIGNDGVIDKTEAHELLEVNKALVRTLMRMRTDLEVRIADPDVPSGPPS